MANPLTYDLGTWGGAYAYGGHSADPGDEREYGEVGYGSGYYGANALDPVPSALVEIQRPNGEWLDITCDVRELTIDRGRSSWVEAFKAGTLSLTLYNPAGIYSGWTPDSVWLQTMGSYTDVPIRVRCLRLGTSRVIFTGTTDSVADSWPGTVDAVATVLATDGFKKLARHNGGPRAAVGASELTGARINRLATDAAWPADTRAIDAGTVPLSATTMDGVTVDLMRQVGEAEWGWLYMRGDGYLTFRQRDAADTDPRMTTVQAIFTDTDADANPPAPTHPTILEEPFNALTAWVGGTPTLVAGRNGNGLQQSGSGAPVYTAPADYGAQWTVGFAYRQTNLTAVRLFAQVRNDTNDNAISLQADTTGALVLRSGGTTGTVLGTSAAGVVAANVWAFIEVAVTCAEAPSGAVTVRVNGANVIGPLTGVDTHGAGSTSLRALALNGGGASAVATYDDLYITTGAFLGDQVLPLPTPIPDLASSCYGDLVLMTDSDRVINGASVTTAAGVQSFSDATSTAWYGPLTWTRTDLPILNAPDGLGLAQAVVQAQAFDDQRVDAVTFDAVHRPTAWEAAQAVRLLDRVRVIRTFPGGWQLDAELIVQGRRDVMVGNGSGRPGSWTITLSTASAANIHGLGAWDESTWDDGIWGV